MQRFLKWLGLVFVGVIVLLLLLGWTPDTDRAEMIEKYSSTASQFVTDGDGMSIHYRDEGNINFFEGNYSDYESWLKQEFGQDIVEPHRLKYKRMAK